MRSLTAVRGLAVEVEDLEVLLSSKRTALSKEKLVAAQCVAAVGALSAQVRAEDFRLLAHSVPAAVAAVPPVAPALPPTASTPATPTTLLEFAAGFHKLAPPGVAASFASFLAEQERVMATSAAAVSTPVPGTAPGGPPAPTTPSLLLGGTVLGAAAGSGARP